MSFMPDLYVVAHQWHSPKIANQQACDTTHCELAGWLFLPHNTMYKFSIILHFPSCKTITWVSFFFLFLWHFFFLLNGLWKEGNNLENNEIISLAINLNITSLECKNKIKVTLFGWNKVTRVEVSKPHSNKVKEGAKHTHPPLKSVLNEDAAVM